MQTPLRITFRGIDHSEALAAQVRARASALARFRDLITSCHVTVEVPHQNHRRGNLFHVHVDVDVPGVHLVVGQGGSSHAHEDPLIAIRESFDATVRRLEDYVRRRRDTVRHA